MKGILLIILVLFFNCKTSFAAQKKGNNDTIITKIKSNFIDIKRENETVYFYGNVIAERQDFSILADKMRVYYYEDARNKVAGEKTDKSQVIKKIIAEDNVKIFNDEFTATGKLGVYNPKENNFILEKDVIFNNGTSVAKGQKFVYNLTTKKGNLVGVKNIKKDVRTKSQDPEGSIQGDDGRVIVIIDDNDAKKSKQQNKQSK